MYLLCENGMHTQKLPTDRGLSAVCMIGAEEETSIMFAQEDLLKRLHVFPIFLDDIFCKLAGDETGYHQMSVSMLSNE